MRPAPQEDWALSRPDMGDSLDAIGGHLGAHARYRKGRPKRIVSPMLENEERTNESMADYVGG